MQTRRLVAVGIAVALSIPVAPFLVNRVALVLGTDVPLVFAGKGWTSREVTATVDTRGLALAGRGPTAAPNARLHTPPNVGPDSGGVRQPLATSKLTPPVFFNATPETVANGSIITVYGTNLAGEDVTTGEASLGHVSVVKSTGAQGREPTIQLASASGAGIPAAASITLNGSSFAHGVAFAPDTATRSRYVYDSAPEPGYGMSWGVTNGVSVPVNITVTLTGGWYDLRVPVNVIGSASLAVEYRAEAGTVQQYFLVPSAEGASEHAATIYVGQPGSLTITIQAAAQTVSPSSADSAEVVPSASGPTVHALTGASFLEKIWEIAMWKALLTVFLLFEVVPITVWILVISAFQALVYKLLQKLPRTVRRHAEPSIRLVLRVVEYCGIGGCLLVSGRDMLGIVGVFR